MSEMQERSFQSCLSDYGEMFSKTFFHGINFKVLISGASVYACHSCPSIATYESLQRPIFPGAPFTNMV